MSFIFKGGYDIFRKQVLNISLKRTDKWTAGSLFVNQGLFVCKIVPQNENTIELVKYDNRHALLLNNNIIYEDKKLFSYNVELEGMVSNDQNPNDFMDCNYMECYALKHIGMWRRLN